MLLAIQFTALIPWALLVYLFVDNPTKQTLRLQRGLLIIQGVALIVFIYLGIKLYL